MLNEHGSSSRASDSTVTVRARHRIALDTLVFEADLSEHQVVATILEDHDIDQMVEWARLADDDEPVMYRATLIHVTALRDARALRDLPVGAQRLVDALCDAPVPDDGLLDVSCVLSLNSLRGADERTLTKQRHPTQNNVRPRSVADDELLRRTRASDARTQAAVMELLQTREAWPGLHHAGTLLRAANAIRHDWSLGDARLVVAGELEAMAKKGRRG